MECFYVSDKLLQCSGNPSLRYEPAPSLTIRRYINDDGSNSQTFVPHRYLNGLLPTALLEIFNFWQNDTDDSIVGYMPVKHAHTKTTNTGARSILKLDLQCDSHPDKTGSVYSV